MAEGISIKTRARKANYIEEEIKRKNCQKQEIRTIN